MPRKYIKTTLGALALCGSLVAPSASWANQSDVREHVRNADSALAKAETLVSHNQDALAAVQMARANAQTRRAAVDVEELSSRASARGGKQVAKQFNQNAETYAELVDEVGFDHQERVAQALERAVAGRNRALTQLTGLLGQVPENAVTGLTRAIVAISTDGDVVESVHDALQTGRVSPEGEAALEQALARVEASMQAVIDRLSALVSTLPPEAQSYVQQAQGQIQSILDSIGGLIGGDTPLGGGSPF